MTTLKLDELSPFAVEDLAQSQEGLLGIISSATDAIITVNEKQIVTLFNRAAEEMFGRRANQAIGQPLEQFIPRRFRATHGKHIRVFSETGVTARAMGARKPLAALRADGTEFPVEATISQITVGGQKLFTAILRDTSERKRSEDALRESEGRLRAIVETAVDGIITIDESGHITSFNPAAARLFGYTPKEVNGININLLMPSPYHEEHDRYLRNYLGTGIKKIIGIGREVIGLRKDGSEFPMDLAVSETQLSDKRIFTGIVRDVSERKRAELSAVLLAALVESSSDAVIGKGLNSIVTSWNAAAERIFGFSSEEMIGRSISLIVPPDHQLEEEQILATIRRGERIEHFETQGISKAGLVIDVSVTISPVKDSTGRVIGASRVLRDITERKRAAEEIRQLNADLEHRVIERTAQLQIANNEMEAFSYSVSHDLRAPLRAIDGFSQALSEDYTDKLDENGQDSLKRIRAASQRMGYLIDDLLNLSRLTRVELIREAIDLSNLGGEIVNELRDSDPAREVSCSIAQGLVAHADPRLLHIVLTNLFSNAWKFTAKTSGAHIEFGCTQDDGAKAFFVRDNGAGFDMAYAGKLFGAFQRMHAAEEFPGTGVGLATVQRIIHRHGGRVWAESAVGVGATFHFTL